MTRVFKTAVAVAGLTISSIAGGAASTLHTVYTFCSQANCSDGKNPGGSLAIDSSGALYGTTSGGGAANDGVVFRIAAKGHGKWKYQVLYDFCKKAGCADGAGPYATPVIDTAGDLYGTTLGGGLGGLDGTVFELIPGHHGLWKLKILYAFCSQSACADGMEPSGGLTYAGQSSGAAYDGTSPLYGTTQAGGSKGHGTIYELVKKHKSWQQSVIYNFCNSGGACSDGAMPIAPATADAQSNIYGTTFQGGDANDGTVFELTPNAKKTEWVETVLHSFGTLAQNADGLSPAGQLLLGPDGTIYGTAASGGAGANCPQMSSGCGTLFKLTPGGRSSFTLLYSFCGLANCADGTGPEGNLLLDGAGSIVGATFGGGTTNSGTAYSFDTGLSVLYSFCQVGPCSDGLNPEAGLTVDGDGNLFGMTTFGGGGFSGGVVYQIMP